MIESWGRELAWVMSREYSNCGDMKNVERVCEVGEWNVEYYLTRKEGALRAGRWTMPVITLLAGVTGPGLESDFRLILPHMYECGYISVTGLTAADGGGISMEVSTSIFLPDTISL